jgi:hypothetical protein
MKKKNVSAVQAPRRFGHSSPGPVQSASNVNFTAFEAVQSVAHQSLMTTGFMQSQSLQPHAQAFLFSQSQPLFIAQRAEISYTPPWPGLPVPLMHI